MTATPSPTQSRPALWPSLAFCALVAYLSLFLGLGSLGFMGADEPRYARIGQEMWKSGDWVTPHLEGRPWLEKPPLAFWAGALSQGLFGEGEAAARLPSALFSFATAWLIGWWAYRTVGSRAGLASFLILLSAPLFPAFARTASTDAPLTAALSAASVCAFVASRKRSALWGAASGVFLGAAVLAKGPVALILLVPVLLGFRLLLGRRLWSLMQILAGTFGLAAVSIPWFWQVWRANGFDFVATFWINHHLARFASDIHHHSQPFWYYGIILALGFFPWAFFLPPAALMTWKRRSDASQREAYELELFLWLWLLTPLLFFSISQSKLAGYILPVFPPAAVLTALLWDRFIGIEASVYRLVKKQLTAVSWAALLLAMALPPAAAFFYGSATLGWVLALPLAVGVGVLKQQHTRGRMAGAFLSLVSMMTLFIALAYSYGGPRLAPYHSAQPVLEGFRFGPSDPLVFYRYFHHSARHYADYQATHGSIHSYGGLLDYIEAHPREEYRLLTKQEGWIDLRALFHTEVLAHEADLYLIRLHLNEPIPPSADRASRQSP